MNEKRVLAFVLAVIPDPGCPDCAGEDEVIGRKEFKTKAAAVRWVMNQLLKPIPEGRLGLWGHCIAQEWDEGYHWCAVEESDSICRGESQPPKWFKS